MKSFLKRFLAVVAIVAMTCGAANAQFRFGIKAGANFNSLKLSDPVSSLKPDNGTGFTGGVMTEFQVPIIGICADASLMYTRMNAKVDGVDPANSSDLLSETTSGARNFFEIPVNIKYKLSLPAVSSIVAPYAFTGPSFAFKLGGNNDVFKTKTFQCAWNVGIGVELIRHLQISGSYAFGINNVMDKMVDGINTTSDIKLRNNYWTVSAAWLF